MHFAGLKSVGESITRPLANYENNVAGTLSLLRAMQGAAIRALVFSSTANIYGAPHYLPVDEAHPMAPTNPYGCSKLQVEQVLANLAAADAAWRVVCLRYFNPVGAHDSGLIGEDPGGTPDNLMPVIARVASGWRAHLDVYGWDYPTPDGAGVRGYIHVMDLAALDFLVGHTGWHAFNLGTGQGHSVLEMERAFEATSGRPVPCRVTGRRPGDVAACYASAEKARTMLAWQARRTLKDMCASSWNWQQHNEQRSS